MYVQIFVNFGIYVKIEKKANFAETKNTTDYGNLCLLWLNQRKEIRYEKRRKTTITKRP